MRNKQLAKILVGVAVSAALIVWLVLSIDWAQVLVELREVNVWYLLPVTGVLIVHFILRAVRWRYLLFEGKKIPVGTLFECMMIGNFATYVLPLRAGEFVRPAALSFLSDVPFSRGFASVVIERFFDLATVLISFALVAAAIPGMPDWVAQGAFSLVVLASLIFVFIFIATLFPDFTGRVVRQCCGVLPSGFRSKIESFLFQFVESAKVLRDMRGLASVLGLTFVVWMSNYFFYQVSFPLCGLEGSLWHGTVIGVVLALAVAAPSAPGFVGVYQTACLAVFALFGWSAEKAMAYAIVTHLHQFIMVLGLGFFTLGKHNLSLTRLRSPRGADEEGAALGRSDLPDSGRLSRSKDAK